jgi:hypothetical protein
MSEYSGLIKLGIFFLLAFGFVAMELRSVGKAIRAENKPKE